MKDECIIYNWNDWFTYLLGYVRARKQILEMIKDDGLHSEDSMIKEFSAVKRAIQIIFC